MGSPDRGTLPDGRTWEQLSLLDAKQTFEQQQLFAPPPQVKRPAKARPKKSLQAITERRERATTEQRRRIDALIADGYCARHAGAGCGWRYGHSPNCPLREGGGQ